MKFTRKTAYFGIAAAVIVTVGVVAVRANRPKVTFETEKIGRGAVIEEVSVTGSLSPTRKIALEPDVSGRVVKLHVDEGSMVKEGEVMAELDSRDLQSRIASQRAAVNSAKARMAELVAGVTPEELAQAETAVATSVSKRDSAVAAKADAETGLTNAQTNYANVAAKADILIENKLDTLLLDYDKAVADAKDSVERLSGPMFTTSDFLTFTTTNANAETNATATRGTAKAKLIELTGVVAGAKASGTLEAATDAYATVVADMIAVRTHLEADREILNYASGLASSTLSTYQQNVSSALSTLNATIQTLSGDKASLDLQAKLNSADITAAQISLSNARAALTSATFAVETSEKALAQANADLALRKTGNRPEVIAAQRARVEVEEAALTGLFTDLSKRKIVSPIEGVVTEVAIEIGGSVQPGKTAIAVQAKGNFEITTNISEIDIGKVEVGDPVHITLDAFTRSDTWTGKVASIQPAEKVVEGVIFYETVILFDVDDPRLRSGMTANLAIETDRREDVLRVPLRALREKGGKAYVQVLVEGKPVERPIETGVENNVHAEVVSGLSDGEEVVVAELEK